MAKYWFDHVHVGGPDPAKTSEFYEKILGARRLGTINLPGGRTLFQLELDGGRIAVSPQNPQPIGGGRYVTEHFGIRTDNIYEAVEELKQQGIRFVQEIFVTPKAKITFFLGPDDVLIELLEKGG